VAKETTVIPITIFEIFRRSDKETADLSNQFPPKIKSTNPEPIRRRCGIHVALRKYIPRFELLGVDQYLVDAGKTRNVN
jgi:hypothetical protein